MNALSSTDWKRRLEAVEARMNEEGIDPKVIEMILSQGASGLVRPSTMAGGLETQLDGFVESGVMLPDSSGNLSGCVVAGMQFGHCIYTPGGSSTLGLPVASDPAQRESRRLAFFKEEAKTFAFIAGGLTMWPTGRLLANQGSIAIAVVPETYGLGTDFASIADLPGAVIMSIQEVAERGISVPMLLTATRRAMPIDNGSGGVAAMQVSYTPGVFEDFQNVDVGSATSMYLATAHFVRPAIMFAITGADNTAPWLVEWRHAYEYVPKFRREAPVPHRSAMGLEDAHAKAAALVTPEWIRERTAPEIAMAPEEHFDATSIMTVKHQLDKKIAEKLGQPAPEKVAVPRRAGKASTVIDSRRTLEQAVGRAKAKDPGFVDKSIARARKGIREHYPTTHSNSWWDKTMGRAGELFSTLVDAAEFGYGLVKDFEGDEDAQKAVNSAISVASML